jgi:phosphatidylglycerophosphate synthase
VWDSSQNLNVPNAVSVLRMLLIPVLLELAFRHQQGLFTAVLAAALLMDILDGYLARLLHQQTRLGAQLDSWGDFLTVFVYPFAAWWLRPQALLQNAPYAVIAASAYLAPIVFGFIKFRRLTSYHTRLTTIAAYAMGAAMIVFFAGGSSLVFRAGCLLLVLSQIEEVMISTVLPRWTENVPNLARALKIARGEPPEKT